MYRLMRKKAQTETQMHSNEFFHLCIVGRSGCGKTRFLLQLLKTEFFKKFNAIFLICPTFEKNQSYHSFYTDEKVFIIPFSIDHLEKSIKMAREEACKYFRSLIIFDDVIGCELITSRTSPYVNLLIGGRHDGISTISLTQQLTSLSKPARDQFTRIITFYNPDAGDRKIMFEKYLCDITEDEKKAIISFLRGKDYSKLDINILKGTYILRK